MDDKQCVNAAIQTKYGTSVRGVAFLMSKRWVNVQSDCFIRPGTEVETLLFLKEPERVEGEVRWAIAEPTEDKIVYKMGIRIGPEEPVA